MSQPMQPRRSVLTTIAVALGALFTIDRVLPLLMSLSLTAAVTAPMAASAISARNDDPMIGEVAVSDSRFPVAPADGGGPEEVALAAAAATPEPDPTEEPVTQIAEAPSGARPASARAGRFDLADLPLNLGERRSPTLRLEWCRLATSATVKLVLEVTVPMTTRGQTT